MAYLEDEQKDEGTAWVGALIGCVGLGFCGVSLAIGLPLSIIGGWLFFRHASSTPGDG